MASLRACRSALGSFTSRILVDNAEFKQWKSYRACTPLFSQTLYGVQISHLSSRKTHCFNSRTLSLFKVPKNVSRTYSSKAANSKEEMELALPERVRALVESRKSGTLTTVSLESGKDNVAPLFGSIMPYVMIPQFPGCPIFGLQESEQHFKHVQSFSRASFVVFPLTPVEIPPAEVPVPRINFTGEVVEIENANQGMARQKFLERHPAANDIMTTTPYKFFQFVPSSIYFLAAQYGKTEIVGVPAYQKAKVDPVAVGALQIINTMNTKHLTNLYRFCEKYGGVRVKKSTVFMFFVDRIGFNLMAKGEDDQWTEMRLPFPYPMESPSQCLEALETSLDNLLIEMQ